MRNDVRELRAVPTELVPEWLRLWEPRAAVAARVPVVDERPVVRTRRPCQMMMIVDQLAMR